jgi:hydroxyacyl-ACP dehydratase HTD2-like protein with hotdog domain
MSLSFRRLYSTVPSSATSVASQFLAKYQSLPPQKQTQFLDGNQLQRLSATLSRPEFSNTPPKAGTPLPPCYHLAYFTPAQVEEELGQDGTDTTFNPPSPFTRRMWAGGELEWASGGSGGSGGLKIGQEVVETTKLVSAVGKTTKAGEEMVVVGVRKEYENENGVVLVDKR